MLTFAQNWVDNVALRQFEEQLFKGGNSSKCHHHHCNCWRKKVIWMTAIVSTKFNQLVGRKIDEQTKSVGQTDKQSKN